MAHVSLNGKLLQSMLFSNETNFKIVEVLFQFCRIGEIDTLNEKFQGEIYIESKWVDKEVKNNHYDPKKMWNPELFIENAIQLTNVDVKYHVSKINDQLSQIVEVRHVTG